MANAVKNKYTPDWVSPGGETLADILKERKITRTEFVNRMGLPKKTVNQLIKGKVELASVLLTKWN